MDNTTNSLFSLKVTPKEDIDTSKAASSVDIGTLYNSAPLALFYFILLSMCVYLTSYASGRYYGGLVKGRCKDEKECEKRMMRMSAHLQDKSGDSKGKMWNPLAVGTMGWVVAQALLGVSFL
jgi:hypothetical protein